MEKLTLKEIAGYLPYGLEFIYNNDSPVEKNKWLLVSLGKRQNGNDFFAKAEREDYKSQINTTISLIKPILYPLETLTKTIFHNGEIFVPFIELAKIEAGEHNVDEICTYIEDEGYAFSIEYLPSWFTLYFNRKYCSFARYDDGEGKDSCQNDLKEKLYEWHFDIHGLIPRGLAIDKSTLNSKTN